MVDQDTSLEQITELPDASFLFAAMSDDFIDSVVRRALESRERLSTATRQSLNGALDSMVKLPGSFRTPHRAPYHLLHRPVCELMKPPGPLALAVLRAWLESEKALRLSVTAQLESLQAPVRPLEALGHSIKMIRPGSPEARTQDACLAKHAEWDEDDVKLAVALLTGRLGLPDDSPGTDSPGHGASEIEQLLEQSLSALKEMSPLNPVWDSLIPQFSDSLISLIETKRSEREAASTLDVLLKAILTEHAELMEFFQWNVATWNVSLMDAEVSLTEAHAQATHLQQLLAEYAPLHERAPSVLEELERSPQRNALLPQVMEAGSALQRILYDGDMESVGNGEESTEEDAEPACSPEDNVSLPDGVASEQEASEEGAPATIAATGMEEVQGPAPGSIETFTDVPPCEIEGYVQTLLYQQDLETENEELEHQVEGLKDQVKDLERQLYESRSQQESLRWAAAYKDNPDVAEEQEAPELETVWDAVELARERYPGQLLFQLNADSTAENSPFKWPEQVWRALDWLATDYFTSRLGETTITDLNQACLEACNMQYKASQHETTMTQYRDSYTTRVDGQRIWLGEHLVKGTSFDPRRTIRIAFDWDKTLGKVVIGFIGQHQRTAAS